MIGLEEGRSLLRQQRPAASGAARSAPDYGHAELALHVLYLPPAAGVRDVHKLAGQLQGAGVLHHLQEPHGLPVHYDVVHREQYVALGVQLAGDAWYFGTLYKKKTIGDALRPVECEDIRRANRLMYASAGLLLIVVMLLYCSFNILTLL